MIIAGAIAFHVGLLVLAFYVGRDRAAPGVAVFFIGLIGFQLIVNGPESFFDGGCDRYSIYADDC